MNIAGLILAGGKSQRMGRPKALLPFRGATFLDTLIDTMSAVCAPVIVVLGHDPERIQAGISKHARFVVNRDYELGQLTSLQCGLRAVDSDVDAVAFTPVDYPAFSADTLALLTAKLDAGSLLAIPRFEGRRGHPVVVRRSVIPEFLELDLSQSAREVIHRHRELTRYVDVDDPGILKDVDTPEAYAELLRSHT